MGECKHTHTRGKEEWSSGGVGGSRTIIIILKGTVRRGRKKVLNFARDRIREWVRTGFFSCRRHRCCWPVVVDA